MKSKSIYLSIIVFVCALFLVVGYGYSEDTSNQGSAVAPDTQMAPAAASTAETAQPAAPEVNTVSPAVTAPVETPTEASPVTVAPAMEAPKNETLKAETPKVETQTTEEAKPAAVESKEIKWVWGEVTSVDVANSKIAIKYLNYDTDVEETLNIGIDSSTRFENAEGINAIKAGDNVGVDYLLNANGEAMAKSIALEKAESMPMPEKTEAMPSVSTGENVETPAATLAPQEAAPAPQMNAEVVPAPQMNAVEAPAQK